MAFEVVRQFGKDFTALRKKIAELEGLASSQAPQPEDLSEFGIKRYVDRFGLDFTRLGKIEHLRVFFLARQLEPLVNQIMTPVPAKEGPLLVPQEVEQITEVTRDINRRVVSQTPTDDMDFAPLDRIEDLATIAPHQWVLEEVSSELFLSRAMNRQLLAPIWEEEIPQPVIVEEETKEIEPDKAANKHCALVLLDVSVSMKTDNYHLLGKALALSFLRLGNSRRSQLAMRMFGGEPLSFISGQGLSALQNIAVETLTFNNYQGRTDIDRAIDQAIADIKRGEFPQGDILLITDHPEGVKNRNNPLGNIRLHTLHLLSANKTISPTTDLAAMARLKEWSTTYYNRTEGLPTTTRPSLLEEDHKDFKQAFDDLFADIKNVPTEQQLRRARSRIRLLRDLPSFYIRHLPYLPLFLGLYDWGQVFKFGERFLQLHAYKDLARSTDTVTGVYGKVAAVFGKK